ncbi:MAG: class I SAM-dependent methyltransferase [Actinobacteria bacterium]|nr:class I SAM-dependent methyltransferase [Actinomycetota bacterium]
MCENRDFPSLEGDWDRLYLEYPDVYDRFARTTLPAVAALDERFDLRNKVLADVGSGTGCSTFELARHARFVVGLEPWKPMRDVAIGKVRSYGLRNVAFVDGIAEALPLRPDSIDAIVSIFGFPFWFVDAGQEGQELAERFVADALGTVKPGGHILVVGSAPHWGAGELTEVVWPPIDGPDESDRINTLMTQILGFHYDDVDVVAEYESVQEAVATYGFIYGQRAIEYLLANDISSIKWKLRIHYRTR